MHIGPSWQEGAVWFLGDNLFCYLYKMINQWIFWRFMVILHYFLELSLPASILKIGVSGLLRRWALFLRSRQGNLISISFYVSWCLEFVFLNYWSGFSIRYFSVAMEDDFVCFKVVGIELFSKNVYRQPFTAIVYLLHMRAAWRNLLTGNTIYIEPPVFATWHRGLYLRQSLFFFA